MDTECPRPLNSIPSPPLAASKNSPPQPHAAWIVVPQRGTVSRETINARSGSLSTITDSVHSSRDVFCNAAPREIFIARSSSEGTLGASAGTNRDKSYIAALLSLHSSMEGKRFASLTRTLIDCVRRASDVSCNDVEFIKQLVHDIDSVIDKISSLCKS